MSRMLGTWWVWRMNIFPVYLLTLYDFVASFHWGVSRLCLWSNSERAAPQGGDATFGEACEKLGTTHRPETRLWTPMWSRPSHCEGASLGAASPKERPIHSTRVPNTRVPFVQWRSICVCPTIGQANGKKALDELVTRGVFIC